jgi:hypothetical protein
MATAHKLQVRSHVGIAFHHSAKVIHIYVIWNAVETLPRERKSFKPTNPTGAFETPERIKEPKSPQRIAIGTNA